LKTFHHEEFNSGIVTIRNYLESELRVRFRGSDGGGLASRQGHRFDRIERLDRGRRLNSAEPFLP
jgi:hypothetical protein